MRRPALLPALPLLAGAMLAACGEGTTAPAIPPAEPQLARANSACVRADRVVSTEAALRDALASADPGSVIAIDGVIEVASDVEVTTEGITLTCASPGSGLRAAPASGDDGVVLLLSVWAPRVAVRGLFLDGTESLYTAYYAFNNGSGPAAARDNVFVGNRLLCNRTICGFWIGTTGALVTDNVAVAKGGSTTGLHFQGARDSEGRVVAGIDGARIERNEIHSDARSDAPAAPFFGGIRPRDGRGVVVAHNVVVGPWHNSISAVALTDSEISGNRLEGATRYGVAINIPVFPALATGNRIHGNRIELSGTAGIYLQRACGNSIHGNNLQRAGEFAAIFDRVTGNNALAGNTRAVVDNGDHDCDGDGASDPNRLAGRTHRGLRIGQLLFPSVAETGRETLY